LLLSRAGTQLSARVELRALSDSTGLQVGFACLIREQRAPIDAAAQRERLELLRAQEALRLRDEFLVTAAHELRTPLTAAHLQLRGLQRAVGKEPPEALRVRVERAVHGTLRLSALIEKLLDISRLEQGPLELRLERMDLAILLESVVQATAQQARRAGCAVRLDCPSPLWVMADALRMEQLLVHLLENAFRHAPGTPVELTAVVEHGQLSLRLCDGGPGLPEAALGRLFQRFETFDGPGTTGSSGLGLGLFLSRQIAEAHRGTLTVESRPEGGLALTAHLPVLA
jgi:signal transduction histidine kinase